MATDYTRSLDDVITRIEADIAALRAEDAAEDAQHAAEIAELRSAIAKLQGTPPVDPPEEPDDGDPPPVEPPPVEPPVRPGFSRATHVGVNAGIGYNTDPGYVDRMIAKMRDLGVRRVRMGMDGIGGGTVSTGFSFAKRDVVIDKLIAAGMIIHTQSGFHRGLQVDGTPEAWRRHCAAWMQRYGDKITVFAVGNESEINGVPLSKLVPMTKIAAEERDRAGLNGKLLIEGGVLGSIDDTAPGRIWTFEQLVTSGIDPYVDIWGLHAYSIQYQDARFRKPWDTLKKHGNKKPIGLSEVGTAISWLKGDQSEHARHYERLIAASLKWNAAYNLLFTLDHYSSWTSEFSLDRFPQTHAAVKTAVANLKQEAV